MSPKSRLYNLVMAWKNKPFRELRDIERTIRMAVPVQQHELGMKFGPLVTMADHLQVYKYCIHQVANTNMMRAVKAVTTYRGRDPRDYALVPFGGAGPLHAARIAEELGISTIVVPPSAGVISAYGLVASDYTKFDAVTRKMKLDDAAAAEAGRPLYFGHIAAPELLSELAENLARQLALVAEADDLPEHDGGLVTLMTLHTAKGLEFDAVFLTGLEEAVFPHARSLDDPVELQEERRLAYVGVTRARKRLYLSRADRKSVV